MSSEDHTEIVKVFDSKLGSITSGMWAQERNMVLAGTSSGIVAIADLSTGEEVSFHLDSSEKGWITSMSLADNRSILVVTRRGGIFTAEFDTVMKEGFRELKTPGGGVSATIWRSSWGTPNLFFYGGTYGKYKRVRKTEEGYDAETMSGHTDSIFGLATSSTDIVAAGDYFGKVSLTKQDEDTSPFQHEFVGSGVQGICWDTNRAFAVVTKSGRFSYFEQEEDTEVPSFRMTLSADLATGEGRCITITPDSHMILVGTSNEVIQFDLNLNSGKRVSIPYCVDIWSDGEYAYVLTQSSFLRHKLSDITAELGSIALRQVKVSLIGHTGAGKTSLCRHICHGDPGDVKSTVGKNVYTWNLGEKRRIVFHDHGGQEAVVGTFIPFLGDSDVILILFKRTDVNSLDRAFEILEEVEETIPEDIPVYFVETHIDSQDATLAELRLETHLKSGRIQKHAMVSPKYGNNMESFQEEMLNDIDWANAKIVIRSIVSDELRTIIAEMILQEIPRATVSEILRKYTEKTGKTVQEYHLRFILRNLANEGIIDYYPDILKYVVLNDHEFNTLRSKVPILAKACGGILEFSFLQKEFPDRKDYVALLDEIYAEHNFLLRGNGKRVFPQLLDRRNVTPPKDLLDALVKNTSEKVWTFRQQRRVQLLLTRGLFDMGLECQDITKSEGLFCDGTKLVLYYNISETGSVLRERGLAVAWTIGGTDAKKCQAFKHDFDNLLESVLGEPINSPIRSMIGKGESAEREFKRSLNSKLSVARAIAAFGNTSGGNLVLGVEDATLAVIGVDGDYATVSPPSRDGFGLRVGELVNEFMGHLHRRLIKDIIFEEISGHDVCLVEVGRSPEPVFIIKDSVGDHANLFYYRSANGTQKLEGDDMARYVRMHWPGRPNNSE